MQLYQKTYLGGPMNSLQEKDIFKLDALFNEGGYTNKIATSHDKLEDFFYRLEIDIDQFRCVYGFATPLSKGKTMLEFWRRADDEQILRMLKKILEKLETDEEIALFKKNTVDYSVEKEFLKSVIESFEENGLKVEIDTGTITKEKLMANINDMTKKEDYILAIDRIHTLLMHTLKQCLNGTIDESRKHTLEYLLSQYIEHTKLSKVEKIKLRNDKNFCKEFNESRNNRSFSHDNEGNLISNKDAMIMCQNFIQTINIISKWEDV